MSKRTGVWLDDLRIADLETRNGIDLRIRYTGAAQDRWPLLSPVLSCSLPLQSGRQDALPFGRGLLPEGRALESMAKAAGVAVNATFALLARYGRDVAGALVIADEAPQLRPGSLDPYAQDALTQAVDALEEEPLALQDDSELSLAGFEDKLLLVRTATGWARPVGGRPSTHILKRDNLRHPGIVDAEAAALRIAAALGLTTIDPRLVDLGEHRCLIVRRFDRIVADDGTVTRVHQEDLCQATGTDTDAQRGRAKYQAHGGPGFADAAELLRNYAAEPATELRRLLRTMVFTVLIGNADAHGKNLALLHPTAETVRLAPLYDTVPTALWPTLRTDAAMTIGGTTELDAVTMDALEREARSWSIARPIVPTTITDTIERARQAALDCGHGALAAHVLRRADDLCRR